MYACGRVCVHTFMFRQLYIEKLMHAHADTHKHLHIFAVIRFYARTPRRAYMYKYSHV